MFRSPLLLQAFLYILPLSVSITVLGDLLCYYYYFQNEQLEAREDRGTRHISQQRLAEEDQEIPRT